MQISKMLHSRHNFFSKKKMEAKLTSSRRSVLDVIASVSHRARFCVSYYRHPFVEPACQGGRAAKQAFVILEV